MGAIGSGCMARSFRKRACSSAQFLNKVLGALEERVSCWAQPLRRLLPLLFAATFDLLAFAEAPVVAVARGH